MRKTTFACSFLALVYDVTQLMDARLKFRSVSVKKYPALLSANAIIIMDGTWGQTRHLGSAPTRCLVAEPMARGEYLWQVSSSFVSLALFAGPFS